MSEDGKVPRRSFLKQAAGALGAATRVRGWPTLVNLRSPKKLRTGKDRPPMGKSAILASFAGAAQDDLLSSRWSGSRQPWSRRAGTAARLGDIQSSKQGKAALAWLNLQATFEP
jgi:hypothetical protein